MNFDSYLKRRAALVDSALGRLLPKVSQKPSRLSQAMRYAVLSGGKRVRPVLVLAAAEAVGGDLKKVLPAACAIEMIHNYSLVHDDLPCMDDDDLRRGRPTCHVKYGEETAVLAGDALLTLAFQVLARPASGSGASASRQLVASSWIAEAAGAAGMVGGQALDLEYSETTPPLALLKEINSRKSGALIAVSSQVGAYLGGGTSAQVKAIKGFGERVGLLFQIVDDILDDEGYAKKLGLAKATTHAREVHGQAQKHLRGLGKRAAALEALADFVLTRKH